MTLNSARSRPARRGCLERVLTVTVRRSGIREIEMLRFPIVAAVLLLSACALNERDYYAPGYSQEQVAREAADCEMKAEAGAGSRSTIYDACMRSKGFQRR